MLEVKAVGKVKKATIRARVWRESTQTWEDLGVISRFRDSLFKRIMRSIRKWLQFSHKQAKNGLPIK